MNTKKPLSIHILYWLTQITYWLYMVVFAGMAIMAIYLTSTNNPPQNLQITLLAPFTFDIVGEGTANFQKGDITISFEDLSGHIQLKDTPQWIITPMSLSLIGVLSITFMIMLSFRRFVVSIYRHGFFEKFHSTQLKNAAIWGAVLWLYSKVYFYVFAKLLMNKVEFDSIVIKGAYEIDGGFLLIPLILWVISHMLAYGTELKNEQNLTV